MNSYRIPFLLRGPRLLFLLAWLFVFCGAPAARGAGYVWWEGERPGQTNFSGGFSATTFARTRDLLSGGDWLSSGGNRAGAELFAKYTIQIPATGEYFFWTRKFWKHGPFKWRFGSGPWQICGTDPPLSDDTPLAPNVNVNWVPLGTIKLEAGATTFELRLLAARGENTTAAFDCFLLTPDAFRPAGKLKPGERSGRADDGYFPFEPAPETFSPDAILDLRHLNEKAAGESGFLRRDGDHFVLGDGRPVRFWGVNVRQTNVNADPAAHDYLARKLAKLGVNLVRVNGIFFDVTGSPCVVDPVQLDHLQHFVSSMKREGIYTELSFYFPAFFKMKAAGPVEGYGTIENKRPWGLIFFEPRVQAAYRDGYRSILATPNPYTGTTLAQDPSLGIVDIVNEDSLFFFTLSHKMVPDEQWAKLETLFGQWLKTRYGSIDKAIDTWGGARATNDDDMTPRATLFEAGELKAAAVQRAGGAKAKRLGDEARFLAELQRAFYTDSVKFLRDDLHVGGLICPGNWRTVDRNSLESVEHYTYTAGDIIDDHGYFAGKHEGEGSSYSIRVGQKYADRAGVYEPVEIPLRITQVEGFPQIISEIGWTQPNRFRADATFATSAYASLQGIDGVLFFTIYSNYVADTTMNKLAVSSPVIAGAFPAAALQYRRGDVREAAPAATIAANPADLFKLNGAGSLAKVNPLAYYVGAVRHAFGTGAKSDVSNLSKYLDPANKTIHSNTGEIHWDYGKGLIRVNTPRSQGAVGFLSQAGRIELGDVAIESANEYGAVSVISLDDLPLASSKKILIQAITEERPYGFRAEGDRITDVGGWPFGMKKIAATVSLKSRGEGKVTVLEENGYATDKVVKTDVDVEKTLKIHLPQDAIDSVVQFP